MNVSTHGSSAFNRTVPGAPAADRWASVAFVVLALALVAKCWVGYLSSDDPAYADAAESWLSGFPFVSHTHWGMRHTVVLPIAASFALFGRNDFTLALPTLLYWAGIVLFSYAFLRRYLSRRALALGMPILVTAQVGS